MVMHRPLVLALGRWRQVDSCAFKATLELHSKFQACWGYTVGVEVEVVVGYLAGQK